MKPSIDRQEMQTEALSRATSGQSLTNLPAIIHGFISKGIPADEIRPRENVFTYHAWRALGRQVRRGEHGVKICTYVPMRKKEQSAETGEEVVKEIGRHPWTAVVFHVSQTDPIAAERTVANG